MADETNVKQKLPYFMQGNEKDLVYHLTKGKYANLDRAAYVYIQDTGQLAYVDIHKNIHKIVGNNKSQVVNVTTLPPPSDAQSDVLYICGNVVYIYDADSGGYYPTYQNVSDRVDNLEATVNELIALGDVLSNNVANIQDELDKIPIRELVGTLDNPIIISDLSDGIYGVKGQYSISPQISTVYLSGATILFLVLHNGNQTDIRKITNKEIYDYSIVGDEVTTDFVVMQSYLENCGYATVDYVDSKLLALSGSLQDLSDSLVDTIDDRIDKKILSCSDEDIRGLFK
jgi:hypothetical protein